MTDAARPVLVLAASTRTGSINRALAHRIVAAVRDSGRPAEFVDLADYEMPMYHGDLERADGVPAAATELAERLAGSDRLVVVTPEYNGAFPPLLKNTVDWLTRVERGVLARLTVHLAAASPGGGGGRRVLSITRTWLESMRVEVATDVLSVPNASLDDDGGLVVGEPVDGRLDVDTFVATMTPPTATDRARETRSHA